MNAQMAVGERQRGALANRLVADLTAAMETLGVWLGLRLGLYAALDRTGPATAAELASGAGIDVRYAREWLEQQAVTGIVVTGDAAQEADQRRYELPPPHREVLLDELMLLLRREIAADFDPAAEDGDQPVVLLVQERPATERNLFSAFDEGEATLAVIGSWSDKDEDDR